MIFRYPMGRRYARTLAECYAPRNPHSVLTNARYLAGIFLFAYSAVIAPKRMLDTTLAHTYLASRSV